MAERSAVNGIGSVVPPFAAGQRFGPNSSGKQIQSVFAEVTVDTTTTVIDPVFATLISSSITTSGGDIEVHFSFGATSDALVGMEFRLFIDGTLRRSTTTLALSPVVGGSGGIVYKLSSVAAGVHPVVIEWAKPPGAAVATIIQVRPVANPNGEHGSLLIHEVLP